MAGFELCWHIPVPESVSLDVLDFTAQANLFIEQIPIRLIAIPIERSHLLTTTLSYRGVYSYQPGRFYIAQVTFRWKLHSD